MAEVVLPAGISGMMSGMEGFIFAVPFIIVTAILGIVLFIIIWKTPAFTFLRAFIGGRNIVAMRRKDGVLDLTLATYQGGLVRSKYGSQILDSGSAMPEKKSGVRMAFGLDSVGITLSPDMMQTIRAIQEQFNFKDVKEIEMALKQWRKCENKTCGFEGVAVPIFKEHIVKIGDIEEKEQIFSHLECPECNGKALKKVYPDLKIPLYKTVSMEDFEKYFKYNYTPSRNDVIIEREVRSQLAKQRQVPVKWIAIGIMLLCMFIGIAIGLNFIQEGSLIGDPAKIQNLCNALRPAVTSPPIVG